MITCVVNADLEALLRVTVRGPNGQVCEVDALIDTGFSGDLTLPSGLIAALGLPWLSTQEGMLADGSVQDFDVFAATVIWDGAPRMVELSASDAIPLLGMNLLRDHELRVEVRDGGAVTIQALP